MSWQMLDPVLTQGWHADREERRMQRARPIAAILILALMFLAAACGGTSADQSSEQPSEPDNEATQTELAEQKTPPPEDTRPANEGAGPVEVETTVLASGLEAPWGLAFLPDGSALVTERDSGRLSRLDSSGNIEEIQTLPSYAFGAGGLLGIS